MEAQPTPIPYGRLDEVLRSLGFTSRVVDTARVFRHEATGAVIMYPNFHLDYPALPHHLDVVRVTLKLYNFAVSLNPPMQAWDGELPPLAEGEVE